LAAEQHECRDRTRTAREAGEPAALFSSLRRQGADHRGLITERSRGTEAAWKERRVDFLRTIIF
jgi:hypothetical protein